MSLLAGGVILSTPYEIGASLLKPRVVISYHSQVFNVNGEINGNVIQYMIDEGIKALTGFNSLKAGWKSIFPNYESRSIVGLKINCVTNLFPTHSAVVEGVTSGLTNLFEENNIIVWDRIESSLSQSGYPLNNTSDGVRYLGTDSIGIGYDFNRPLEYGDDLTYYMSSILTKMCDYTVNIPVLKDHSIAGVTLSMKNYYGAVTLDDYYMSLDPHVTNAHKNNCDPGIPFLYSLPEIKDKNALIILDALKGAFNGGPIVEPQWNNNMLILGFDPVAVDLVGMSLIEEKRVENSLPSVIDKAHYLDTAASMGLGVSDPNSIDLKYLNLG